MIDYSRITEIKNEISGLYKKDKINKALYKDYLQGFEYGMKAGSFKPRSIITIATRRPQHRVYFNIGDRRISTSIPPTYVDYKKIYKKTGTLLNKFLLNTGHKAVRARLPEKLVAVRGGLARYGKNNISYIGDFGSFYQLTSFFSDMECAGDNWHKKKELEECRDCLSCLKNCPTGAISAKQFILRSGKCLTYHNESEKSFPEWIDPRSHNCLIGCMRCQDVCPCNKSFSDWIEDLEEFTVVETESILECLPGEKLPSSVTRKIDNLNMEWLAGRITRNLKALLCNYN